MTCPVSYPSAQFLICEYLLLYNDLLEAENLKHTFTISQFLWALCFMVSQKATIRGSAGLVSHLKVQLGKDLSHSHFRLLAEFSSSRAVLLRTSVSLQFLTIPAHLAWLFTSQPSRQQGESASKMEMRISCYLIIEVTSLCLCRILLV